MKIDFRLGVATIALVLLLACLVPLVPAAEEPLAPAVAMAAESSQCVQANPRSMPRYAIAGLWAGSRDRDTFILVEPVDRSLARFDRGEVSMGAPPRAIASTLDFLQPIGATGLPDGGMVIEALGGRFWQLDSDMLQVTGVYDVARQAGLNALFPFRWELVGDGLDDGGLVVCGDVQHEANGPWTSGLFYIRTGAGAAGGVRQLHVFEDLGDLNRLGCRLGGQVFAVVDGVPYVLLLSGIEHGEKGQPQIYRIDVDIGGLTPLELHNPPEEMLVSPPLATFRPAAQFAALMQDVEASTMPTEMVGWDGSLYVVLRRPSESPGRGMTDYRIARIDPDSGEVVVSPLESTAHHLLLVPGPERFAVVEKDAARSLGDHRIQGFNLVPTKRMQLSEQDRPICR